MKDFLCLLRDLFKAEWPTMAAIVLLALVAFAVAYPFERARCRAAFRVARTSTDSTLVMTRGTCWLWGSR